MVRPRTGSDVQVVDSDPHEERDRRIAGHGLWDRCRIDGGPVRGENAVAGIGVGGLLGVGQNPVCTDLRLGIGPCFSDPIVAVRQLLRRRGVDELVKVRLPEGGTLLLNGLALVGRPLEVQEHCVGGLPDRGRALQHGHNRRIALGHFLYINQGYTSDEISNMIELPEALNRIWYTRQYYGTVAHNSKAVYQKFMGWYDGNPVNLNPLTPSDSAKKWVEYLGDTDRVLQMAQADFDKGEYQWVAEVTNTLVFADPTNIDARLLCADALEQLGYQAESGPWRNEYLTAAQELRYGNANFTAATKSTGAMIKALSAPMLFDYMAIVMDKQALADVDFVMNVTLPDVNEQHMLRVKNGVVLVYANALSDAPDVSITCPKNALFAILTNNQEAVAQAVQVEGDAGLLTLMMENMNQFPIDGTNPFNIVEP